MPFEGFELKDLAADAPDLGVFAGMASVYSVTDRGGDVVLPGAFTKSLDELQVKGSRVPLLWMHDQRSPIGMAEVTDTPNGLQMTGSLLRDPAVPDAQKVWALMKGKVVNGLSIGYTAVKASFKGGVRQLQELKLFEISVVTIPMNPYTTVVGMKAQQVLGAIDGMKADEEGAVDALFDGIQSLTALLIEEQKAGRVLSARNLALVKEAYAALDKLSKAGAIDDPPPAEPEVAADDVKALRDLTSNLAAFAASITKG